ncbi:hypothetical protein IFM89_001355, partial [Coptis chinensis]
GIDRSLTLFYKIDATMSALMKKMCWELLVIKNDTVNQVGATIFRKPTSNECYEQRAKNEPPLCKDFADANVAWWRWSIVRLNVLKFHLGGTPRKVLYHNESRLLLVMRTEGDSKGSVKGGHGRKEAAGVQSGQSSQEKCTSLKICSWQLGPGYVF